MSVQDRVESDLRRFIFEDTPDNVDELRAKLKRSQGIYDEADNMDELRTKLKRYQSISDMKETRGGRVVERPLFSDAVNKELAKHRPNYIQKRRGIATFGLAFFGLAMFSFLMLPEPLNWIMAAGCLIPFVGPLFKYKMAKRRVRHP